MIKNSLLTTLVTLGLAASAYSTATLTFSGGELLDASGVILTDNSIIAIFADNNGDSLFPTSFELAGQTLVQGGLYGGNGGDELLFLMNSGIGAFGPGTFNGQLTALVYDDRLAAGTELSIYWFDQLSSDLILDTTVDYGTWVSTTIDTFSGGDNALILPTDPSTVTISYFDNVFAPGAQATPLDFTADQTITIVPEPTGASLLALASGMFMLRRNRKK